MFGKLLQPEAIFYQNAQKAFGVRAPPRPAGGVHSAPPDHRASRQGREGTKGGRGEESSPTTNSRIRHWRMPCAKFGPGPSKTGYA